MAKMMRSEPPISIHFLVSGSTEETVGSPSSARRYPAFRTTCSIFSEDGSASECAVMTAMPLR